MSEPSVPPDLDLFVEALLVIENLSDAKDLIENPDLFEDLEFHASSSEESESEQ